MRSYVFCAFLLFTQCAKQINSVSTSTNSTVRTNKLLEAEVSTNFTQVLNESKTYLLAVEEKEATATMIRYVVLDIASQKILKKGSFRSGHIKWRSNTSLELLNAPGMIPEGKDLSDYIEIIQLPTTK